MNLKSENQWESECKVKKSDIASPEILDLDGTGNDGEKPRVSYSKSVLSQSVASKEITNDRGIIIPRKSLTESSSRGTI